MNNKTKQITPNEEIKDYSDTYPKDFFELFGSISEKEGIEEPQDLAVTSEDINV